MNVIFKLTAFPGGTAYALEAVFHSGFLADEGPGCCAYLLSLWYNNLIMNLEYLDHRQGIVTAQCSSWREVDAQGRAAYLAFE